MAKDANEIFSEIIPKAILENPEEARKVGAIFCFRIHGEGGGSWIIDLASEEPSCVSESESNQHGQCIVELGHEDFKRMLGDAQVGMQLYFEGRMKINGAPDLATKLFNFFSLAKREE